MTSTEIRNLLHAFGWVELPNQKNPYMLSFRHDESGNRMNVYFTTMTVTVQAPNGQIQTIRNVTPTILERIAQ